MVGTNPCKQNRQLRALRLPALLLAMALAPAGCPPTTVDAVKPLPTGGGAGGGTGANGGSSAAAGHGATGGGGAAPDCTGVPSGTSQACNGCRDESCCSEALACAAEPECLLWLECEEACDITDEACLRACWVGLPASPSKAAYVACKHRECASSCGLTACTDPAFGYEDDAHVDECGACQREHCCSLYDACLQDPACSDILECYATCEGDVNQCNVDELLPAQMTFIPIWSCRAEHCMTECAGEGECTTSWTWNEECNLCQKANCCDETYAATVDPDAMLYFDCVRLCDDSACKDECAAQYPTGAGLYHTHQYCLISECPVDCSWVTLPEQCGGLVPVNMLHISCKNCTDENCCTEGEGCARNAECAGLYICVDGCDGDAQCQSDCRATFTAVGTVPYDALAACQAEHCPDDCE